MNKIKVIDLLNMISKGEEVPKRIKYKDEIRDYNDKDKDYTCSNSKNYFLFFNILRKNIGEEFKKALNDEVEILEEEKKIPEKLDLYKSDDTTLKGLVATVNVMFEDTANKINEILDYLKSKEKGE